MGVNCYFNPILIPVESKLVTFGNNVVIGGMAVVTRNIEDGVAVGRISTKVIGSYYDFAKKKIIFRRGRDIG